MRRWITNVLLIVLVLGTAGTALYLHFVAQSSANKIQIPADWPVPEIAVPDSAANVIFEHFPNSGCYELRFDDPTSVRVNFSHFELPLLAAGYIKCSEPETYNSRKLEMRFVSDDGKREIFIRYFQRGGRKIEQDWLVQVTTIP